MAFLNPLQQWQAGNQLSRQFLADPFMNAHLGQALQPGGQISSADEQYAAQLSAQTNLSPHQAQQWAGMTQNTRHQTMHWREALNMMSPPSQIQAAAAYEQPRLPAKIKLPDLPRDYGKPRYITGWARVWLFRAWRFIVAALTLIELARLIARV